MSSYRAARKLVPSDLVQVTGLLRKEALVDQRRDRLPQAIRAIGRGLRLIDGTELTPALRSRRADLEVWYAWCRIKQGRYHDGARWASLAVSDAQGADDWTALAEAYEGLCGAYLHMGRTPPQPYGAMALELFRELGNVYRQARSLNHLGFAAAVEGEVELAADLYSRARETYAIAGDAMGAAAADYNIADLLIHQGRLDKAQRVLRAVLPVFQSLGSGEWTECARRELGRAALRGGRVEEGAALLDEAREGLHALGLSAEVVEADAALVEVLLVTGQWDQALDRAGEVLRTAISLEVAAAIRDLHRHRAAALAALGHFDQARAALDLALAACAEEGQWDVEPILIQTAALARAQADHAADELLQRGRAELVRLGHVSVSADRLLADQLPTIRPTG